MIGFFLSVNLNSEKELNLSIIDYMSFKSLSKFEDHSLYIFSDDQAQSIKSEGCLLYNIGVLIHKNLWGEEALVSISNEIALGKNWKEIANETRGQFCLLVFTKKKEVLIITDKLGCFPIYKFGNDHMIQISNIFNLLTKHNKLSLNEQAVAEYVCLDYCIDCFFFNEIKVLDIGSIYKFGKKQETISYYKYYKNIEFHKYNELSEVSYRAKQILMNNLSFLNSDDKIFVDITGGFDTRTILTILKSMDLKFEGGFCGEQVLGESTLSKKLAQSLGIELHSNIGITDKNLFKNILNKHFEITGGVPIPYHSSELINYYDYIKERFNIHLTGFSGTELTQSTPNLRLFSRNISFPQLFEKHFKYQDIFNNNFIDESHYYHCLDTKLIKLLDKIGSNVYDEVIPFLLRSTYSKYYHGTLIGTHNTLLPSYSPFLESNFVRLMFETSLKLKYNHKIQRDIITQTNLLASLIMTSHGYNANLRKSKDSCFNEMLSVYIKNLARRFIYQFSYLKKTVDALEKIKSKTKNTFTIAETQRKFWIDEVDKNWSSDLKIFEIIDIDKLNSNLTNNIYASTLKAKILYLNKLIENLI